MSHDIIICGTGGSPVTDKTITVYDAPLSVALKSSPHELAAQAVATGKLTQEQADTRVAHLVGMIEHDWNRWGDYVENHLHLPYERHTPHSQ